MRKWREGIRQGKWHSSVWGWGLVLSVGKGRSIFHCPASPAQQLQQGSATCAGAFWPQQVLWTASLDVVKSYKYGWTFSVPPTEWKVNIQNYGIAISINYSRGEPFTSIRYRCVCVCVCMCMCVCIRQNYYKKINWLPKGCYCPHIWLFPPSFCRFSFCFISNFIAFIISPWIFWAFIMLKIFSQLGMEKIYNPYPANNFTSRVPDPCKYRLVWEVNSS